MHTSIYKLDYWIYFTRCIHYILYKGYNESKFDKLENGKTKIFVIILSIINSLNISGCEYNNNIGSIAHYLHPFDVSWCLRFIIHEKYNRYVISIVKSCSTYHEALRLITFVILNVSQCVHTICIFIVTVIKSPLYEWYSKLY